MYQEAHAQHCKGPYYTAGLIPLMPMDPEAAWFKADSISTLTATFNPSARASHSKSAEAVL